MFGTIRNIQIGKNFGFIKPTDGKLGEYFFHRDDFKGHWQDLVTDYTEGKDIKVEFDDTTGPRGLRAENVNRTDWPNQ